MEIKRFMMVRGNTKNNAPLLELRLTGCPGKPGPSRLFIFDSRYGNRNISNLVEQSPDVLFELIQIVVHDANLAAVKSLIEKGASIHQTLLVG
jgi:hypothetical protein